MLYFLEWTINQYHLRDGVVCHCNKKWLIEAKTYSVRIFDWGSRASPYLIYSLIISSVTLLLVELEWRLPQYFFLRIGNYPWIFLREHLFAFWPNSLILIWVGISANIWTWSLETISFFTLIPISSATCKTIALKRFFMS